MTAVARQVQLARNPEGAVRADDFVIVEAGLPPLRPGEVRVRNRWMSIDPYMRLALSSQAGFLAPMKPGDAMGGAAVGVVEESRDDALPAGTAVLSQLGWRTQFVAEAGDLAAVDADVPGHWHFGLLGLTGITAWLGVEQVLKPGAGETIVISGAAGAVGSIACQLARRRGARVLGSAGSAAKAAWLVDAVGVDAAVDYKAASIADFLHAEAPDGIDCHFDNVGGAMLATVLDRMKPHGRVGLCGAMSQYQTGDYRSGPGNFFAIIERSLRVEGFNAFLLSPAESQAIAGSLRALAQAGDVRSCETVSQGLDGAIASFVAMFGGSATGKAVIEL